MYPLTVILLSTLAAPQGDTTVVDPHLSAHSEQTLETARTEQRLLLIKGVPFGVGDDDAQCATKGHG